jgi:hypothetical protein
MDTLSPTSARLLGSYCLARGAANRPDAKVKALSSGSTAHPPGGEWSTSGSSSSPNTATQNYLLSTSRLHGFAADGRLELMYGGMDLDQREKIKQAFQAHPAEEGAEVRILLATDTASEGIDLQNHCSKLIHVEIPWNPNVMEQRNGRIDRYGQRADVVEIFHFVPPATTTTPPTRTPTRAISPATSSSCTGP